MLSDSQFLHLTHNIRLPRITNDRRKEARAPFSAVVKVYPIRGKSEFGSAIVVRCKDLSPGGVSFLSHALMAVDDRILIRFSGQKPGEKPLNMIGAVVRVDRLSPVLFLVASQFKAVPQTDITVVASPAVAAPLAAKQPATLVASVAAPVPAPRPDAAVPTTTRPAPMATLSPQWTEDAGPEDPSEAELARIRAAVLL